MQSPTTSATPRCSGRRLAVYWSYVNRNPHPTIRQTISRITSRIRSTPSVTPRKTRLRPWSNHVRRRLLMSSGQPHHPRSQKYHWLARQCWSDPASTWLVKRLCPVLSGTIASICNASFAEGVCSRVRSTPSSDRGWKSPHWILTTWTPTDPSSTWVSYRRPLNEWWRYASMNTWKRAICCHRVSPRTTHTILPIPPWSTSTTV